MSNPAHSFIKIGCTEKDPTVRANELFDTNSPFKNIVEYWALVDDWMAVEKVVHAHLNVFRINNKREFLLPHYFTFGEYEKDLLKKYNIKYQSCKAVGSVKLGLFLEKNTRIKNNRNCICFISQYVPLINEFKDDCVKRLKTVYSNLITWNNENERRSIRIAMRNNKNDNYYINEVNFFELPKAADIELINNTDYSSYKAGLDSSIVVTIDSTLGFELFGLGKKVLFCGMTINKTLPQSKNVKLIFLLLIRAF